jgi:hypothetical protein
MAAVKRDLRTVLDNQDSTLAQLEEPNKRVAVVELTMKQIGAEQGAIRSEMASMRDELPGMIAETMREVLKESRGES